MKTLLLNRRLTAGPVCTLACVLCSLFALAFTVYGQTETKPPTYTVRAVPEVPGEQVLDKIIGQYSGKVVVADFWATWCGPCLNGMQLSAPVKEKIKNEDVVFIYLTNPSSPRDEWETMIKQLDGDHYYLPRETWTLLMEQIESKGIPTYLIYDKEGKLQHKSIGFMGTEKLEEWIRESL